MSARFLGLTLVSVHRRSWALLLCSLLFGASGTSAHRPRPAPQGLAGPGALTQGGENVSNKLTGRMPLIQDMCRITYRIMSPFAQARAGERLTTVLPTGSVHMHRTLSYAPTPESIMHVTRPFLLASLAGLVGCAPSEEGPIRTDVAEAMQHYEAGMGFVENSLGRAAADSAVIHFQAAVEADPEFAQAWAGLARTRVWLVSNFGMPGQLGLATEALARAEELEPDAVETQLASGYVAYRGHRDYDAALTEFLAAEAAGADEDPEVAGAIGNIYRRQGRLDDAVRYYERRMELNPEHTRGLVTLAQTYNGMGDYAGVSSVADRFAALEDGRSHVWRFWAHLNSGDTATAWGVIADIELAQDIEGEFSFFDMIHAFFARDAGALSMLPDSAFEWGGWRYQLSQFVGWADQVEEHSDAFDNWIANRTQLLDSVPESASSTAIQQSNWHGQLALLEALRGNAEAAEFHADQVEALNASALDVWSGPGDMYDAAMAHLALGNHDGALDMLEAFQEIRPLGAAWMELYPPYDPLRGNPRFEELVARSREMERPA